MIAHGSDATDHAKEYLQNGADFVLVGEAEQSLVELCASILAGRELATNIPGVLHLDGSGNLVRSSLNAPRNTNWKNLRRPARDLIDLEPYREAWVSAHGHFPLTWLRAADARIGAIGAPSQSPETVSTSACRVGRR